jgi:hypothetical protein
VCSYAIAVSSAFSLSPTELTILSILAWGRPAPVGIAELTVEEMSEDGQRTDTTASDTTASDDEMATSQDHMTDGGMSEVPKAPPRSERDVVTGTTARERCRGTISLGRDFANAFDQPDDSDFRVVASGTTFHLHRVILKCRSNMFASVFRGGFTEATTSEMTIDNFPPADVEAALRWLYTSEVSLTAANLVGVLRVGDYMQLDGLTEQCRGAAQNLVTVESMLAIWNSMGAEFDPFISAICLDVWARNTTAILTRTPDFLAVSGDGLAALVAHGDTDCSEDVLLGHVYWWMMQKGGSRDPATDVQGQEEQRDDSVPVPAGADPREPQKNDAGSLVKPDEVTVATGLPA